jgi:hypothetical protein
MILLIGFSKAGTASFDYLLKQLGYKTLHSHNEDHSMIFGELIERANNENKPLLTYVESNGYEAITELNYSLEDKIYWPQFTYIHDIINIYDDVIYILNTRDISNHVRSLKFFGIDIILQRDNNLTENIETILETYYANIKNTMQALNRKFIEYNIETDDISKLAQYIDLKGITQFPHKHKTIQEAYVNALQ